MIQYLIWSYRHHQWWRPERAGYTTRIDFAGRYTREEAADIIFGALPGQNLAIDLDAARIIMEDDLGVEAAIENWKQL